MKIALHPKLSKEELLQEGLTRCLAFLDAHNLRKPHHIFTDVKSQTSIRVGIFAKNGAAHNCTKIVNTVWLSISRTAEWLRVYQDGHGLTQGTKWI